MITVPDTAPRRDDEGSLAVAMLLTIVGVMLAALLVPLVVTQASTTRFDARRSHAFDAAQAGVDTMVGLIRAANDGAARPSAVLKNLPCTSSTPVSGDVAATTSQRYQTWVYYFAVDPSGHDDWSDDPSKQIPCASGSGTSVSPSYALVESWGTDTPGAWSSVPKRTLMATYVMRSKNVNVPGGLIHNDLSDPELCLDAGSSSPTIGTIVRLEKCESGAADQSWAYLANSTLSLVSTADATTNDLGLCLAATSQANGQLITVQKCATTTDYRQQWVYGGYGANWHAVTSASNRSDTYCWNAASQNTAGANLMLGVCTAKANTYEVPRSFAQDASVGAGPADAAHKFLVNYNQFGRCFDVNWLTGSEPHLDPSDANYLPYLLSSSCSPTVAGSTQNQPLNKLWNFPTVATGARSASGTITSTSKSGKYCVISKLTLNSYPYTDLCTKASAAATKWTIWDDTGDYTTSYRITDNAGNCLQPTDPNAATPDLHYGSSKIIVTTCSASTLQKWNAPPGVIPFPVKDFHER